MSPAIAFCPPGITLRRPGRTPVRWDRNRAVLADRSRFHHLILGALIRDWLVVGSGSVPIQCAEDRRGRPPVVGHGGVRRPPPSAVWGGRAAIKYVPRAERHRRPTRLAGPSKESS